MSKSTNESAFKQLYIEMLNQGGDFSKVSKDLKKPIKCYVKESLPYFLVTDGYFFVPCYFTKEAVTEFKQKFSNVHITDLSEKVIVINTWSLEMKKVNSSEVFTSYGNIEIRLIVTSFKPNLQEKLNPTRYPINLFRDDEMKTHIQHYRHQCIQKALAKQAKSESLPDISKLGASDGKKAKVEERGVVNLKGGAAKKGDDEFTDFTFKEGTTAVLKISDIAQQEKGKAYKKQEAESTAAARVKGGAKGKKKAASKAAAKTEKAAKKAEPEAADVRKKVEKILKYTPSKSAGKKEGTPTKEKGKTSAKKSTTAAKKQTPAMPSPGGKKSTKTTDQMTMAQFKKYLDWHEKKKGATAGKGSTSTGKVLGKRSAGKASTASGKSTSKSAKKSAK